MRLVSVFLMAALPLAVVAGCGSDDDESSSTKNSAALSRCNQFCDASAGKSCQLLDAAECKQLCSALMQAISADCANKQKAMYDCNLAQADVCDPNACQAESQAASGCM